MEDYFTISQAADEVHVSEQTVVRWLKGNKIPFVQVSERRRLIAQIDLKEFLDSRKISPPKKRIDKLGVVNPCSLERSLTTSGERKAEMDVKSLRKEIARLCQQKRGKVWYIKFRPFGEQIQLGLKDCQSKSQAEKMEGTTSRFFTKGRITQILPGP